MVYCAHCGSELKPGEKFCGECGSPAVDKDIPLEASQQGQAVPPPAYEIQQPVRKVKSRIPLVIILLILCSILGISGFLWSKYPNGIVWQKILSYTSKSRMDSSLSGPKPVEKTSLRIKSIQSLLQNLGYRPGPVDGQMGDMTRNAIMEFQRENGREINGLPTKELFELLDNEAVFFARSPGRPEKNFQNGHEYYYGRNGRPIDYIRAAFWYRRASIQEHAEAQHSLGFMYDKGLGVTRDSRTAFYWYKRAASGGHPNAKKMLEQWEHETKKTGKTPYFGVLLQKHSGQGIKIIDVRENSPAQRAGLKNGDIILEFENTTYYEKAIHPLKLASYISTMPVDKPLRLVIIRNQRRLVLNIKLEEKDQRVLEEETRTLAGRFFELGESSMGKKDFDAAIENFGKAVYYNPNNAKYHAGIGNAYNEKGDFDNAVSSYQKSASLEDHFYPNYMLGIIYRKKNQHDKAIAALNRCVELQPPDNILGLSFELLGHSYFEKRRLIEALNSFKKALAINPESAFATYSTGVCYEALKDRQNAVFFYEKYLALNHDDVNMNRFATKRLAGLKKDR